MKQGVTASLLVLSFAAFALPRVPSGSAAPAPAVSVTVLASGQCRPDSLAVDDKNVYFHNDCDSRALTRVDRAGKGPPSILAVEVGPIVELTGDGVLVRDARTPVWSGAGVAPYAVVPKVGGLAAPRLELPSGKGMVHDANGSASFTFDGLTGKGALTYVPLPSGKPLRLSTARMRTLAMDANAVYAAEMEGAIVRFPRDGGSKTVLYKGGDLFAPDLVVDDEFVYFTGGASKTDSKAGIRRAKKTGGVTLLVPFEGPIANLALAGPYFYFLSTSSTLHRAPRAGGPAKPLPLPASQITAFVLEGDTIYWADQGSKRVLRASLAGL